MSSSCVVHVHTHLFVVCLHVCCCLFVVQACSHSDLTLRAFAADALTLLIRGALEHETSEVNPLELSHLNLLEIVVLWWCPIQEKQLQILSPLRKLTAMQHVDVRLKQQDCVSQVWACVHSIKPT